MAGLDPQPPLPCRPNMTDTASLLPFGQRKRLDRVRPNPALRARPALITGSWLNSYTEQLHTNYDSCER